MQFQPIILGVGEILWDVYSYEKKVGGAPVNFLFHAIQLGSTGYAISAVGNDHNGEELLKVLEENSVPYIIPKVSCPTGTVRVTFKDGIPDYSISENVAWDNISLTKEILNSVRDADSICFGTLAQRKEISRNNIRKIRLNTPTVTLRCYDVNLCQIYCLKEIIKESLNLANVLKINYEELTVLTELFDLPRDIDTSCKSLIKSYQQNYLTLTAGSKYSTIYDQMDKSHIEIPEVCNIIDTVGVDDAFLGAFVFSILSVECLTFSHQKAVAVATFVCTKKGSTIY